MRAEKGPPGCTALLIGGRWTKSLRLQPTPAHLFGVGGNRNPGNSIRYREISTAMSQAGSLLQSLKIPKGWAQGRLFAHF